MSLMLRVALAMGFVFLASPAWAACTLATSASATIGARTSYEIREGRAASVSASETLACNGSIVSLVASDHASATATSTNAFTLRSPSGEEIAYRLSADPAGAYGFTQGSTINYLDTSLLSLLGVLNGNTYVAQLFATLIDAPNVAAGTYTDVVAIHWSWSICRGIGVGGLCTLRDRGSGTTTLTVSVTVSSDCRITAPPLAFLTAPLARQFAVVTQPVAIDCTKGAAFSIAFTAGVGRTSRPWREMRSAAGHALRYNLYYPDGTTIWDEASPRASQTLGTGATTATLLHTYVAKIDPDQATPPAGSYSDNVSVVVTF